MKEIACIVIHDVNEKIGHDLDVYTKKLCDTINLVYKIIQVKRVSLETGSIVYKFYTNDLQED